MWINYLKIALRNLVKHPRHSFFNIIGLSVGMAAAIIIVSFVLHELSYDEFHENKERIYRVIVRAEVSEGKTLKAPMAHGYLKKWAEDEFPSIESIIRLDQSEPVFHYKDKDYRGNSGYYADSLFLNAFTFSAKYGNAGNAMKAPDQIVLVEDMANKIFGEKNPVGEVILMGEKKLEVSAVLKDTPPNSHMDFDFLVPMHAKENPQEEFSRRGVSIFTYVLFNREVDKSTLSNVSSFMEKRTNEAFEELGLTVNHYLQPLEEAHLNSSNFQFNLSPPGNKKVIYTLTALALLIILIAVINYVNMETARSEYRAREIGMRKVSGAGKRALIRQFLGESLMLSFIALLVAFLLVELFIPDIENLLRREFHQFVFEPSKIALYVLITILIGLTAGFYPAIYLAGFSPVRILKGSTRSGRQKNGLRQLLVVVQFCIATFLIISLLFINRQLRFLKNKELGFAQEQVVVLRGLTDQIRESYSAVKNDLNIISGVKKVTGAQYYPGNIGSHQQLRQGENTEGGILIKHNRVQDDYRKTLDFRMKKGRYFKSDLATDSNKYVVNEKAVDYLGLKNPMGKELILNDDPGRVIGVMENYHTEGLQNEIMPLIHTRENPYMRFVMVRIDPGKASLIIDEIEKALLNYDQSYHLDYVFLDQYFDNLYNQEERIHKLNMAGSGLAILIAIMGLYALASFVVIKRTGEVGIRKAMGATGSKIALLINKDIIQWVLLANILSWPLAWYFLRNWLQNFAYHIDLNLNFFIIGTIGALMIAIVTVSYHTIMAARTNPAETLREE
jgi:ABC-type antimicrobial peptide transport system permease subunit